MFKRLRNCLPSSLAFGFPPHNLKQQVTCVVSILLEFDGGACLIFVFLRSQPSTHYESMVVRTYSTCLGQDLAWLDNKVATKAEVSRGEMLRLLQLGMRLIYPSHV